MKYAVTVEAQVTQQKTYFIDAATENEASLTAVRMAERDYCSGTHFDVVSVQEAAEKGLLR